MLPGLLFSETVQRSASSLLDQASLITKKVALPVFKEIKELLSLRMRHTTATEP